MGADALAFELHPARGDESRARREQGASLGVRGRDALRGALARHSDTRENGILVTPLRAALNWKDEKYATALLDGGDNPNEVDQYGWTALHWAARKGCHPPLFERLLAMVQDVNTVGNTGDTAMMFAAAYNHLDVVISLMNHPGVDLNV